MTPDNQLHPLWIRLFLRGVARRRLFHVEIPGDVRASHKLLLMDRLQEEEAQFGLGRFPLF